MHLADFNADIGAWDVSSVTDMLATFGFTSAFNADISAWDTSKVATMSDTFRDTTAFNADISAWDVSRATTISNAFSAAAAFNADIGAWDVSQVTTMAYTLLDAAAVNQDIGRTTHNYNTTHTRAPNFALRAPRSAKRESDREPRSANNFAPSWEPLGKGAAVHPRNRVSGTVRTSARRAEARAAV